MLVVHPSSTCDVCLDRFSDDTDQAPHSIPCGHVFCKRCLSSITPRTCPLCRRNFQIDRARKLHIDMTGLLQSPGPPPPTQEELEVKELEKRVAEACMEGVSEEDCREIISQVLRWLETKPLDFCAEHKLLHQTVILLHRYKRLQEKYAGAKDTIESVKRKLKKAEHRRHHDRTMTEVVAESYESRIAEVQQDYLLKIESLQAEKLELSKQLHEYTASRPNPLPLPPQPVPFENLPEYARPHASAAIGDEYFREILRYKQGSAAPQDRSYDYGYDYDYNAYSSSRSRDKDPYHPDYSYSSHNHTTDHAHTGNSTRADGTSSTTPKWWANLSSKPSVTFREPLPNAKDPNATLVGLEEEFGKRIQRHNSESQSQTPAGQNQSHGRAQGRSHRSNDVGAGPSSIESRSADSAATVHDHNHYNGNHSHTGDISTSVQPLSISRHHTSPSTTQYPQSHHHSHVNTQTQVPFPQVRVTEDGMLESRLLSRGSRSNTSQRDQRDDMETPLARPETVTSLAASLDPARLAATRAAMMNLSLNVNPATAASPLPAPIPARMGTKHHVFLQESVSTPTLAPSSGDENVVVAEGERRTHTAQRIVTTRNSLPTFPQAETPAELMIPPKATPSAIPNLRTQTSTSSLLSNHSGRSISRDEAQRLLLDDLVHESSRSGKAASITVDETVPRIMGSKYPGGYASQAALDSWNATSSRSGKKASSGSTSQQDL